jgi:hypothetical protein
MSVMKKTIWTTLASVVLIMLAATAQRMIESLDIGGGYGDTGISLQEDGDILFDGTMTGDGSGLTGVGATDVSDAVFRVQDNSDATKEIAFEASGITTGTVRTITMADAAIDLGDIATNTAKTSNVTHTGDVTGATALTIAAGAVDIAHHSATGTADGTTYLRGDGTWTTPSGSGDMVLAGTQTNTGAKTFNDATMLLAGSTSGTTTLKATAAAGTTTATFQAVTGTVALSADVPADTDSLTEGSTNRYVTTSDETTLGHISVTQAVNLDSMETDIATNSAKVGLAADAVTNAYLANMAQRTLKGRADGAGTGDPTDLTPVQIRTIIEKHGTLSGTTAPTWNSDTSPTHTFTLSANATIAADSGTSIEGREATFLITQAASNWTLAWNAEFIAEDAFKGVIPPVSTISGDIDLYVFWYKSFTSEWVLKSHTGRSSGSRVAVTLDDEATIAVDTDTFHAATVTLGGNRTLGADTGNPLDGDLMELVVVQDATGSRTLSYASTEGGYDFSTGLPSPTLSTTAAAEDTLLFRYHAGDDRWRYYGEIIGF